jgi:hypothetical protein
MDNRIMDNRYGTCMYFSIISMEPLEPEAIGAIGAKIKAIGVIGAICHIRSLLVQFCLKLGKFRVANCIVNSNRLFTVAEPLWPSEAIEPPTH